MVDMLPEEKHGFYVEFELRAEEDRNETMKVGHPVFHDIEIAIITMPGGNLVVDKVVSAELLNEWKRGIPGRKPPSPFATAAYEAWKDGREAPVNGIDLKNWPGVTPAQLKMCQGCNIRTVEDLAESNADSIRKMGMGGVALKDKAISYMKSAGLNKNSEEVSALKVEMEALREAVTKRDLQIEKLMEQLTEPEDEPKRRKKAA
jgi:hypothetical protein|tara:strand:- start:1616 stop:2227 length:612 start_codon:yes stop_codon:yes gene_type:complete